MVNDTLYCTAHNLPYFILAIDVMSCHVMLRSIMLCLPSLHPSPFQRRTPCREYRHVYCVTISHFPTLLFSPLFFTSFICFLSSHIYFSPLLSSLPPSSSSPLLLLFHPISSSFFTSSVILYPLFSSLLPSSILISPLFSTYNRCPGASSSGYLNSPEGHYNQLGTRSVH